MIGVKTRMALFFAVVLGIAALCVLAVYRQSPEPQSKFQKRNFDRTVAEGMRLWNPKAGVDSVRFDSCRIEKMRMGAFALGGFNVLCLDGLVLNLPLDAEDSEQGRGTREEGRGKKNGAVEAFTAILPRSFLQRAGVPARSFSGIRIRGLAVNRVENRREVPVFAADEAKTLIGETTIDLDAAGGVTNGVRFIWNAAEDLPAGFKASGVKVKVTATR